MREEDIADDLVISSRETGKVMMALSDSKPSESGTEFMAEVGEKFALFIMLTRTH